MIEKTTVRTNEKLVTMKICVNKSILYIMTILSGIVIFQSNAIADRVPAIYWQLVDEGRYMYHADTKKMDWRAIRKRSEINKTANKETKTAELKVFGDGTIAGVPTS